MAAHYYGVGASIRAAAYTAGDRPRLDRPTLLMGANLKPLPDRFPRHSLDAFARLLIWIFDEIELRNGNSAGGRRAGR